MNLINLFNFRSPLAQVVTTRQRRAVLALGGGGARGLAHYGAIQAVGEAGIQTERFVGVSIGALVGAMCALEPEIRRVQAQAVEFLLSPTFSRNQHLLFGTTGSRLDEVESGVMAWYNRVRYLYSAHRRITRAATRQSLMPEGILSEAIEALVPDIEFSDLPTPLSIVAADLRSGNRIVLENGPLRTAIQASMAIPGIFPPVDWQGMQLCDIGVIDSLPSVMAKSYATDLTIAVDVGQSHARVDDCTTALDVIMRMQDIGETMMRRDKAECADVVIRPDLQGVDWFDFRHPERIIELGRRAARQRLSRLAV
ncbi:NTE family protein RssA [Novipirellula galeiformis]|uniref:NTE family protein RssA n=1 Tax=Novipirellula galeiformis TaxID=2528004 RepID=A0A5C6CFM4_9BACT|nr:patatin-like phospholipase family protein [Novipirellula galeiformis]TWU21549.1 NTE family protein RssA [Novipirellula galeiformis]